MDFERELQFCKCVIQQLCLPVYLLPEDRDQLVAIEQNLRSAFALSTEINHHWELQHRTIYQIADELGCQYTMLRFPEPDDSRILIVGPYTTEKVDQHGLQSLKNQISFDMQQNIPALEQYLSSLPYLHSEEALSGALTALGDCIWGSQNFVWEHIISGIPELWIPLLDLPNQPSQNDMLSNLTRMEQRYEAENRLMQVVSQGRSHTAEMMLANFSQAALEQRTPELTRNTKNYTIILNTLMRKAVEHGGVHPIYIDRISSDFAVRIETLSTWKEFAALWQEMARKYCLLVKKHASKEYSPLIQKVITRIDFDLAADLSLKSNADALNVNASYLSTLFKRETGTTLTDYVNRKRVEHARFMLNTTNLPISAIAQHCGIQDDNYFTKIFKKYTDKTPTQYRQENNRFSK